MTEPSRRSRSDIQRDLEAAQAHLRSLETQGLSSDDPALLAAEDHISRLRRELRSSTTTPATTPDQAEAQPDTQISLDVLHIEAWGQSRGSETERVISPVVIEGSAQAAPHNYDDHPVQMIVDEAVLDQVTRAIEGRRLNAASKYLADDASESSPEIDPAERKRLQDVIDAQRVRLQRTLHRDVDAITSLPEARRILDQLPRARLALPGEEVDRLRDRVAMAQQDLRVTEAMRRLRGRYQLDTEVRNDSDPQDGDGGAEVRDDLAQLKLPVSGPELQAEVVALQNEIDAERLRRSVAASKENTIGLTGQYIGLLQFARDKKSRGANSTDAILADILEVSRVPRDQASGAGDDALWKLRRVAVSRPIEEVIQRYSELARGQATQAARNRLSSARALLVQGEIEAADELLMNLLGTPEWSYVDQGMRDEIDEFRSKDVPEARKTRLSAEKLLAPISAASTIDAVEKALSKVLALDRSTPETGKTVCEAIDRLVGEASVKLDFNRKVPDVPQDTSVSDGFADLAGRFERVAGLIPARSRGSPDSTPAEPSDWRTDAVGIVTNFRSLVSEFRSEQLGRIKRDDDGKKARIDLEQWLTSEAGQRSQADGRRLIARVRDAGLPGSADLITQAQAELDENGIRAEVTDALAGRDPARARIILNALEERSGGPNPETRGIRQRIERLEMYLKVRQDLLGVKSVTVDVEAIGRELDVLISGQRQDDVFAGLEMGELITLHAKRRTDQLNVTASIERARRQLAQGDGADFSSALHSIEEAIDVGASGPEVMDMRRDLLDKWRASLTARLDTGISGNDVDAIFSALDQIETNFQGRAVDSSLRTRAFQVIVRACMSIGDYEQSARQLGRYLYYAEKCSTPQVQSEFEELRRFVSRIVEIPRVRHHLSHRRTNDARSILDRLAEEGFQEPELAEFWSEVYEQSRQWVEAISLAEAIPDQGKRDAVHLRITSLRDAEERLGPINERLLHLRDAFKTRLGPREAADLYQQLIDVRSSASSFPEETARIEAECTQILARFKQRQEEEILRSDDLPVEMRAVPYLNLRAVEALSAFRAAEFRKLLAPLQEQASRLIGEAGTVQEDVAVSQVALRDLLERIHTCLDQLEHCEDPGDARAVSPRLTRSRKDVTRLHEQLKIFELLNAGISQRLLGVRSRADLQDLKNNLDRVDPRFRGPPVHPTFHRLKRVCDGLDAEIRDDEDTALLIEQRWRLEEFERCELIARQAVARVALSTFSDGSRFGKLESIEVDDSTRTYRGVRQIHEVSGQKRGFVATWCLLIKAFYELFEIPVPPNILHVQPRKVLEAVQVLVASSGANRVDQRRDNQDEDDRSLREFILRLLNKLDRGASTSFPEDLDGSRSSTTALAFEDGASKIRDLCANSRVTVTNILVILDREISEIDDNITRAKYSLRKWQDSKIAILRPKGHQALFDEANASVSRLESLRPNHREVVRLRRMLSDQ